MAKLFDYNLDMIILYIYIYTVKPLYKKPLYKKNLFIRNLLYSK